MRRTIAVMSMLVLASSVRRASAQSSSPSPSSSSSEPIEVVVTGTRTPEQSQRATVKTDVITREEAERRGATNVAEALATQPGVSVNPGAYGYLGTVSPIQIQGFDLGRVLILEDGEPLIGDVGGALDLAGIPVNDIERIEVVTGPSSALYGSSAIGGVVNVLSAPPPREGPSGRARVEYRSHNALTLQGSSAYRRGASWVKLDLSRAHQDGIPVTPGLPDTLIPETARSLVGVRLGSQLSRNIDVSLRARWLHQRFDGQQSTEYPGLGRYITDLPDTTDRYGLHFLETLRLGRGSSLRFSLARQWVDSSSGIAPRNSPLGQEHVSSQALHSFDITATLADGPRTWVFGSRFETQRLSQELRNHERASGTQVTRTTAEVPPQGLNNAALYGQLAWRVGSMFTVMPGARAEYHGRQGSVIAPRLALAARPSEAWTIRVGVGRGFRTPSAEELGFNFDHSVYGYKVMGNTALVPERSWGVNGDVACRPAPSLVARVGGFANWVDDLIDIDLASGMRAGSVVTYTYKNFERVRTMGYNVALGARAGERLRFDLAYDYLWTRDVFKRTPLSGRAPHTFTASSRLNLPLRLEVYVRTRFTSSAFVDSATRTPGFQTTDARVAYGVWPSAQAYAGVSNLFDVHQDPSRVGDLRPPMGRVLYLGMSVGLPAEEQP